MLTRKPQTSLFKAVHKSRIDKTTEYYKDERNIKELAVYVALLEACDSRLLYPLLGDPMREEATQSKLSMLHDRETSLIGACLAEILRLLRTWATNDPHRRPWCILNVLAADPAEPAFAKWARGEILRLGSAIFRRFEVHHAGYLFRLHTLVSDKYNAEEKAQVAQTLLAEDRKTLDTYSRELRRLFTTVEGLLSDECRTVLTRDFDAQAYGTDCVERLNAQLVASTPRRSPGKNFASNSREAFLKQLGVVLRSHGGQHPLASGVVLSQKVTTERLLTMPLLPHALGDASSLHGTGPVSASGAQLGGQQLDIVAVDSAGSSAVAPLPADFGEGTYITRENPALLVKASKHRQASGANAAEVQKVGLSPYMLEKNKFMKGDKDAKGSRLTNADRAQAAEDFRRHWAQLREHGVFKEAYELWRQKSSREETVEPACYRSM